jgi:hypothetical protein
LNLTDEDIQVLAPVLEKLEHISLSTISLSTGDALFTMVAVNALLLHCPLLSSIEISKELILRGINEENVAAAVTAGGHINVILSFPSFPFSNQL